MHPVTEPVLQDVVPCVRSRWQGFSIFFRTVNLIPVYDNLHFDLGFPRGVKPYLVTLRKDIPSPFVPVPKPAEEKKEEPKGKADAKKEPHIDIDFDGIESRIVAFPVSDGRYQQIAGIVGARCCLRRCRSKAVSVVTIGRPASRGGGSRPAKGRWKRTISTRRNPKHW